MIRSLFETTRKLDRRIEKVISFDSDESDQLKREITEYVATDNIEANFERMLSLLDEGLGGGAGEVGVWVSGFYGSGKSSFTKYLGFALDPERTIDGKPFLDWLQAQLKSKALRTQLATLAKKHPATVIMLDLASAQIAGATMAEISSVLYWTVLQWAGYGPQLRLHSQLHNTRFYKSELDKKAFCDLYPFLPQHFDILLELIGRLAKTSSGIWRRLSTLLGSVCSAH